MPLVIQLRGFFMKASRVDLPVVASSHNALGAIFNQLRKPASAFIDGNNFFIGTAAPSDIGYIQNEASYIADQQTWAQAWRKLGMTPPGPLPKGCVATLNVAQNVKDIVLSAARLDPGQFVLDWWLPPAALEKNEAFFAFLLLPGVGSKPVQNFRFTTNGPSADPAPGL